MDIVGKNTKKVLCIDDDQTLQLIVKQVLNKTFGADGLEIYSAATGGEGLQKIKEIVPDIILCDMDMSDMGGFEICRRVRAQRMRSAMILMSSYDAESDTAIKASEEGADAYLSKPLKKGELIFVINFVMRVAHLNDTVYEKNKQLEQSLVQLKQFHQKLSSLNKELVADKRRLGVNLKEMTGMNLQMEEKNTQISSMADEIASRSDSTVSLLVNIIELRQADHRGHSERCAEIAVFIAEKMGLSDYLVHTIKTAALLHELGIVALPTKEKMIEAADELKSRDFTQHPLVGEMLLKGLDGFELIAEIIRHLNENVDGSGLPDGLLGDRIPIGARIICAASYFDHARIKQPDLTPQEIFAIVEEKTGIFFDEQVINHLGEYVGSQGTSDKEKTMDCQVFALVEGMELASDVFTVSGINLLKRGTVLDKEMLNKVLKFNNVDPIAGTVKVKQPM